MDIAPAATGNRRVIRTYGDITGLWQRCAIQFEPGAWVWDVCEFDQRRILKARDAGVLVTTWERREDDVVWLLVRGV